MAESVSYTYLSEIYNAFLAKITSYTLLSKTDKEIEENLFDLFKSARANFYKCRNSLDTIEDEETGELRFTVELDPFEIEILAQLMLVAYITPAVNSDENMKQILSDKDAKIFSQASQLRELRLLLKETETTAKRMITEYTYLDLFKEKM